jgi:rhamnose transport system permease protein
MSGVARYRRELSVTVAYLLVLALLAWRAPAFYRVDYLKGLLASNASVLVAAVGMTLVILCRQIDISIGSQFSICAVVAGLLAREGVPMPLVLIGTVLAGAGMGAINGLFVAGAGMPSIVVTLATLVIGRESLRYAREGDFVRGLPSDFQWFGLGLNHGRLSVIAIGLVVFVAFAWVLKYLAIGRAVYATGSDPEAARLAGIRPRRVVFGTFVVMGALAGLAALLEAVQFAEVDPNAGMGLEMQVIAAVVVGGTAISGGRGTLIGSLVGVALLGTVEPMLVFLHKPPQWQRAIEGLIILLAVSTDALDRRGR